MRSASKDEKYPSDPTIPKTPPTGTTNNATTDNPSKVPRHQRSLPVSNSADTLSLNKSRASRITARPCDTTLCPASNLLRNAPNSAENPAPHSRIAPRTASDLYPLPSTYSPTNRSHSSI